MNWKRTVSRTGAGKKNAEFGWADPSGGQARLNFCGTGRSGAGAGLGSEILGKGKPWKKSLNFLQKKRDTRKEGRDEGRKEGMEEGSGS